MNAPDPASLKSIEHLLEGRDATLDAALAWLHRRLQGPDLARLRRLELRYSTHAAPPIVQATAQGQLGELCRQKGINEVAVAVSVRVHELPLDNDAGHLRLRLLLEPLPEHENPRALVRAWLTRLRQRVFGDEEASAAAGGQDAQRAREAVDTLQRGLDVAAAQFKAAHGSATVSSVTLTVHAPQLHEMLAPRMPPADTTNATLWIGRELISRALDPAPALVVTYVHRTPLSDSTELVTEGDLAIRLAPPRAGAGNDAMPNAAETPLPVSEHDTPLPLPTAPATARAPAVTLRVLGTWQGGKLQPLPQAYEATLGPVPTQFSRSALELVGFTRGAHGALARAASNSTPLGFAADGQGGIKLHAAPRPGGLPMYFFAADLAACVGEHPLREAVRLVVNGPAALQQDLWPLVIEVAPAD